MLRNQGVTGPESEFEASKKNFKNNSAGRKDATSEFFCPPSAKVKSENQHANHAMTADRGGSNQDPMHDRYIQHSQLNTAPDDNIFRNNRTLNSPVIKTNRTISHQR